MSVFSNLPVAIFVTLLLVGGPLTAFVVIKLANSLFGGLKVKLVKSEAGADAPVGLLVEWDHRSFPYDINRVRLEYNEMLSGGKSTALSFTFEDKKAQKKSFLIPMKLSPGDLKLLTENPYKHAGSLKRSFLILEVEHTNGEVRRKRIPKAKLMASLQEANTSISEDIKILPPTDPDNWSVFTRVFPWREVVEEAPKSADGGAAKKSTAPKVFDFLVTKVWIEPGCIVCDACENEAPDVFEVQADTCIVRPSAPMVDVGAIVAAAEGCPVDVIKYDTQPK